MTTVSTTASSRAATTLVGTPGSGVEAPGGLLWALRDSWNEATRHLRAVPRSPELLVFAALQPIMFVLLFNYVFKGSIPAPGYTSYTQYLMPGIFAQTVVFNSAFTGVGLAEDLQKGFIDRLRSLPISQGAVLIGRTMSDMVRNVLTFVIMFGVAFAVGFRMEGGLLNGLLATLLLLGFSYSFSWIQALIGMSVKSVEAANSAGFIWMFPMTFVSSAFVPTQNMTPWLRHVAEWNPFTIVTNASRYLYSGKPVGDTVWQSIAFAVAIAVVFSFLAVQKFKHS
ncbi:MAG: ABC transporter permease, partial [Microthrixaceae bacterium]|nr:ABC transporter permease [Microthrixaceae bacterium]